MPGLATFNGSTLSSSNLFDVVIPAPAEKIVKDSGEHFFAVKKELMGIALTPGREFSMFQCLLLGAPQDSVFRY